MSLLQQVEEVTNNATVSAIEESGRGTGVSRTAGTSDTMDIVIDVGGQVVVHDVGDVRNVLGSIIVSNDNSDD